MRLYGSLTNRMAETVPPPEPVIGMGATILFYSDRQAATVIEVVSPSKITVREDSAVRTDSNGMSESQEYRYAENPSGRVLVFTKRKNGAWYMEGDRMRNGTIIRLGVRDAYHDYSF